METIERILMDYWQYVTLVLGLGFVGFGIVCNSVKLPDFLVRNPDATYSLGRRIAYIFLGAVCVLYSLYYIFQ